MEDLVSQDHVNEEMQTTQQKMITILSIIYRN